MNEKPIIPPELPVNLVMPISNVRLLVQGLGQLPYNMVAELIGNIQAQTDAAAMQYLSKMQELSSPSAGAVTSGVDDPPTG